ncbi:MAG TPA: alanine racemase [Gemmatimonadales bacterium]
MTRIDDLPTPALLLDLDRLETNIEHMAAKCRALGVSLRPHVKTHKCIEVADRQRAAGATGITVSTLAEAHVFAGRGYDDITWAFPFILNRVAEAGRLARDITLRVTIDSEAAFEAIEDSTHPFHVWIKIDCGYHRAGLDPSTPAPLALARRIRESATLAFDGFLTHGGHAYHAASLDAIRHIAEDERRAVADLRAQCAGRGADVGASVGSTPTLSVVEHLDGVTEARPGNYAFYDGQQAALGACQMTACALSLLASAVSSPGRGHSVIDAGALALSKDAGPSPAGPAMGRVFADYAAGTLRDDAVLTSLSQEHGIVSAALTVGERVRLLPNHACLAAACFDEYHVVRGDQVVDRWPIHRRREA